ncbi:MAG: DUF695 domain-containing protein [Marmoricola sp.]
MGIFRRNRPTGASGQPEDFWPWWSETGAATTAAALARNEPARVADDLSRAVQGVHPELSWELASGDVSRHVLVVTSGGQPDLRAIARRWLLAAPPADETWSYTDHRPPAEDPETMRLSSGHGSDIDFAQMRVTARLSGIRFDTVVHHPVFAQLPAEAQVQAAFLALDAALGEKDVELWIGHLETAEHSLIDGFGLSALRAVVREHQSQYVDQDGGPSWSLMQGETAEGPVLASAQVPLHPVVAPHLSVHVAVLLPYRSVTSDGMPDDDSLAALRHFEDHLAVVLGKDGRIVAHQSSDGLRVLHVYVDETSDATSRIDAVAATWDEGEAQVQAMADPGWESVAHLRG